MASGKIKQLEEFTFHPTEKDARITTNTGLRVENTDNSLKVGPRGPTLLEDFHFREKITHFDHERIPERVVHARGSGAHGYFQLYESQAKHTKAGFLNDVSHKTPVFVRFSSALGSRGSADTVRDVRGFATRFYTQEGNFDLVGNNIPVFFIQDAIKFPDIIHAGKPEPDSEMPQASTAHDNFWDLISLLPESTHMIMWVLSDRAIPRSLRTMDGFGVHTFALINAEGHRKFVKFHWKPLQGLASNVWDENMKLGGQDPDFHRRDLWESIETGNFPEWELCFQIFEESQSDKFDFDVLDATKIVPEELAPLHKVGKMTLNRNPTEFFPETEQIAFCTQNIVPGIDFTDDPLLQGRNFSYLDTQLLRLGGPNFNDLPINRPVCPFLNNQRDGHMRYRIAAGKVNYWPNRFGAPHPSPASEGGFVHFAEKVQGMKERLRAPKFQEHFHQATLFWNSISQPEKDHLVAAAQFELGKTDTAIQERVLARLNEVEPALAARVAEGLDLPVPKPIHGWKNHGLVSPALSMLHTLKTVKTKKVAILVANGFDSQQLNEIKGALKGAGAIPAVVAPRRNGVTGTDGTTITPDFALFIAKSTMFDAVFIPGGQASVATLSKTGDYIGFVNEAYKHYKIVAAIGDAVTFLREKCTLPGVHFANPSNPIVNSFGVVTGAQVLGELGTAASGYVGSAAVGVAVGLSGASVGGVAGEFLTEVSNGRHWARDVSQVPV